MRAIPTTYAGVEFRSKLEARVANLLDVHRVEWHYESEGYVLSDGRKYLPDFWLPQIRTYIECKGQNVPGVDKAELFALDLTGENGTHFAADEAGEPDKEWMHPTHMVIVAHATQRYSGHGDQLGVVNALGSSVVAMECSDCGRCQWLNIGAFRCRSCQADLKWDAYYGRRNGWGINMELPRLPQWQPSGRG